MPAPTFINPKLETDLDKYANRTDELLYELLYEIQNGGLGGTPAGADTQIQFNDNGAFGASSNFVINGNKLGIGVLNPAHLVTIGAGYLQLDGNYGLSFNANNAYVGNRIDYITHLRFYTSGDLNFIASQKRITINSTSHINASFGVVSLGSTSTSYAMILKNSLSLDLLVLKNNGTLNAPRLPTSSAGLLSGDIWNDAGTLKIIT